jgi:signal transduction histidine kinase
MIEGQSIPSKATTRFGESDRAISGRSADAVPLSVRLEVPPVPELPGTLLDALHGAVLVLDQRGEIQALNQAWRSFALANAPIPQMLLEGANYLAACESGIGFIPGQGVEFLNGLQAVLNGQQSEFAFEYTLNTAAGKKHLIARAARFAKEAEFCVLISHEDLTYYKLAEAAVRKTQNEIERLVRDRTSDLELLNGELVRQIKERKRLEKELLEITDRERRTIGIDLHDELGQQLTGLVFMAKGLELKLKPSPHFSDAATLHRLLNQALNDTRAFAKNLAVMEADDRPLPEVLKNIAKRVRTLFRISCRFSRRGQIPELDPTSSRQLFSITREAVTNAIKHGKAQQVCISLAWSKGNLVLEVKNDGQPFQAGSDSGMGLRNMKYRAGLIGASLEIKVLVGKITSVRCTLPWRTELGPLFDNNPPNSEEPTWT